MKVSPLNIKKQEFKKVLRGYDTEEVEAFLNKLADEFEAVQKENESLKKELDQVNAKLSEYRRLERNLQDALLKAQDSASRAIESTKKQTALMLKEAEIKATQILDKARENANEIRNAVVRLREERNLIIAKLKAIISSQAQLLENKVENAGNETDKVSAKEQKSGAGFDVDGIVDRLL
ncbi:MAG: DivIVA domain-containing protein [Ignavibacteriaceae bacterium]